MDKTEKPMPRSEQPGMGSGSAQERDGEQLPVWEARFREDVASGDKQEQIMALTAWWGRYGHDDSVPQDAKDRVADVLTGLRGTARQTGGRPNEQGYQAMNEEDVERSRLRLMVDNEGRFLGDPEVERRLTIWAVEQELEIGRAHV